MGSPGLLSKDKLLVLLPTPPDLEWIAATQDAYPGLRIEWSSAPNGPVAHQDAAPEVWEGATILFGFMPPPAHLIPSVRFIQVTSAGIDRWVSHEKYKDPDVLFANVSGTQA